MLLWEILGRVDLPDLAQIPDATAFKTSDHENEQPQHWRIPGTENSISQIDEGPHASEFLFSQDTVERIRTDDDRVSILIPWK